MLKTARPEERKDEKGVLYLSQKKNEERKSKENWRIHDLAQPTLKLFAPQQL